MCMGGGVISLGPWPLPLKAESVKTPGGRGVILLCPRPSPLKAESVKTRRSGGEGGCHLAVSPTDAMHPSPSRCFGFCIVLIGAFISIGQKSNQSATRLKTFEACYQWALLNVHNITLLSPLTVQKYIYPPASKMQAGCHIFYLCF